MSVLTLRRIIRKLARSFFLTFLIVLILAFALGPFLLRRMIGGQTMVAWIAAEVADQLHRQIVVEHAHVTMSGAVDLGHVKISEYPTFRQGVFAHAHTTFGAYLAPRLDVFTGRF